MPRQLLTFDAEDLDRHAAVRRYPVAQRLARPLREADRDVVGACRGEQSLCQFRRKVVGYRQRANHAGATLSVAGAHGMLLALLDHFALLDHALDDAVVVSCSSGSSVSMSSR